MAGGYRSVRLRPPSPWRRTRKVGDRVLWKVGGSVTSVAGVPVEGVDLPLPEPVLVHGVGGWEPTGVTLPRA